MEPTAKQTYEINEDLSRRQFVSTAAAAMLAACAGAQAQVAGSAKPSAAAGNPESLVKTLFETLTEKQKGLVLLPWSDPRRRKVDANWAIVESTIGDTFTKDQQELIRAVFKTCTNAEWYPKFMEQLKNDGGGFDNYHIALFGNPKSGPAEWVFTGRHSTMRVGADPVDPSAFGGPIFYGHAPEDTEKPNHPGNLFWYQGKRANEVFQMLDGKQRDQALIALAPNESAVTFRKPGEPRPGLPVQGLSKDQRAHVDKVMHDVLAPFSPADVATTLRDFKASGGLDTLNLAFYKQEDIGTDGVWDIWRLEGPGIVWHFRGAPHTHVWVNIGKKPRA